MQCGCVRRSPRKCQRVCGLVPQIPENSSMFVNLFQKTVEIASMFVHLFLHLFKSPWTINLFVYLFLRTYINQHCSAFGPKNPEKYHFLVHVSRKSYKLQIFVYFVARTKPRENYKHLWENYLVRTTKMPKHVLGILSAIVSASMDRCMKPCRNEHGRLKTVSATTAPQWV